MKEYKRKYPQFALCGLNCGLCPRFQTEGGSKCPGCGGPDFHLKHPSCTVITCSKKHDDVEFCYQCQEYPCDRYNKEGKLDSFITYKNVLADFEKAEKSGIEKYIKELNEKVEILEYLIKNYNDGRKKNYYCIAVNLTSLQDLKKIVNKIKTEIHIQDVELKEKISLVVGLFEESAAKNKIELKLRK
jgi:hypothetical protein